MSLGGLKARRAQEGVGRDGWPAAKRCAAPLAQFVVAFPFGLSTHPHPQLLRSVVLSSEFIARCDVPLYPIVNCVTPTTTTSLKTSKGGARKSYICSYNCERIDYSYLEIDRVR